MPLAREFDAQRRFTSDFAEQLDDARRDPTHSKLEMVRSRVFGILAGYEDQNDHDALRSDVIFKLLADRLPEDGEGHACTWRMRIIKVAARIKVTARCVRVFLSGSWPFLDHFRDVGRAVLDGT